MATVVRSLRVQKIKSQYQHLARALYALVVWELNFKGYRERQLVGSLQKSPTLFSLLVFSITSKIAAPAVAGLAAYLLSAERYRHYVRVPTMVGTRVKAAIQQLAYPRTPGELFPVVWNGLGPPAVPCGPNGKRQFIPRESVCPLSPVSPNSTATRTSTTTSTVTITITDTVTTIGYEIVSSSYPCITYFPYKSLANKIF
jgi:hypothetical protein